VSVAVTATDHITFNPLAQPAVARPLRGACVGEAVSAFALRASAFALRASAGRVGEAGLSI
jgi:hypothetical protein